MSAVFEFVAFLIGHLLLLVLIAFDLVGLLHPFSVSSLLIRLDAGAGVVFVVVPLFYFFVLVLVWWGVSKLWRHRKVADDR